MRPGNDHRLPGDGRTLCSSVDWDHPGGWGVVEWQELLNDGVVPYPYVSPRHYLGYSPLLGTDPIHASATVAASNNSRADQHLPPSTG